MTNINGIAFRESETEAGKVEVGLFIGEEFFAGFNVDRGEATMMRAQLAEALGNNLPTSAEQRETLKAVLHRIHEFNELCEEEEYTDSGDLWEIVGEAYNAIDALFTPTKPAVPAGARKVCTECGGGNAEYSVPAWFNANTHEQTGVDEDADVMYTYCPDCDESRKGNWIEEATP